MCDEARCAVRAALCRSLLLFSLVAGGCAADARDRDSIDELPPLALVEERRIGSVDDPELGFSRLYGAEVDRDGNVYALEGLDLQIRVYSPDGTLLRRIGRRGGGPGEFEGVPRYGLKGDTLWAYDMDAGRITFFDRAGQVRATGRTTGLQVPVRTGWGYVLPFTMGADGRLRGWFARVSYSRDNPPPEVGEVPVPVVRFGVSGAVVDTVGWTPTAPPRMVPPENYDRGRYERITVAGEPYSIPDPPGELPTWLPLPDGYIVVEAPCATSPERSTLSVTRIADAGDTVYQRVLSYLPEPYTEAMLNEIAGQQPRTFRDGVEVTKQVDSRAMQAIRAQMQFPEFRPPIQYPWHAADGAVWLRRTSEPDQPAHWIVLDAEGRLRGELELPAAARPLWSDGDQLWASVPDDSDVPWLVRYRIAG